MWEILIKEFESDPGSFMAGALVSFAFTMAIIICSGLGVVAIIKEYQKPT